jgi:hypothetical protein
VGEDGGAGGGGKFVGYVELTDRDAAKDFGGGGSGEGKGAVSALDCAGTVDGDGGGDVFEFEVVNADGGADKIDDGVYSTHFMEMDGFDRNAVKLGLGLGHSQKHGEGGLSNRWKEF